MHQHFGEHVNEVLNGITPKAFRAFSSLVKQESGIWVPPSIWLTACVAVGLVALYLLLKWTASSRSSRVRQTIQMLRARSCKAS